MDLPNVSTCTRWARADESSYVMNGQFRILFIAFGFILFYFLFLRETDQRVGSFIQPKEEGKKKPRGSMRCHSWFPFCQVITHLKNYAIHASSILITTKISNPKLSVMLTRINRIASGDRHGIRALATNKQRQGNSKPSSNRLNMNEAR